ncbi:type III pantothenate kinase [Psychroflexus tropicus]|uniref:type III pantothenate kinase n=1 Tax=Psychroflexus tropicus TaxID=197345 RepID=UPI00036CEC37|nr:type III pantothenate kinase [Psychroflexus tropicus]
MNLIVDIGNSQAKLAVFNADELILKLTLDHQDLEDQIQDLINNPDFHLQNAIISSTAKPFPKLEDFLASHLKVIKFSHESQLNFINTYTTPATLGLDRIALVAAASGEFPKSNVLVIDAGSCITYDFIDQNSKYHGGAISPGLQMRFKAMHTFTGKLPLITESVQDSNYIGKSTKKAMQIGVFKSICYEIDGYIDDYLADYEDLTVVLTGGDYYLLSASIKNSIFATPNFLLKGLNKILQLNSN